MTVREYGRFPCYGKSKYTNLIVKFTGFHHGDGVGEVIKGYEDTDYALGDRRNCWNSSAFIVITLTKKLKYNKW